MRPEPLTDPCSTVSGHTARATRGRLAPSAETIGFLLLPVDPGRSRLGDPPPSSPRELPRLIATTEQSAPARHIGAVGRAGLPLGPSCRGVINLYLLDRHNWLFAASATAAGSVSVMNQALEQRSISATEGETASVPDRCQGFEPEERRRFRRSR